MAEKVVKVGIKREQGFLYYLDKDGNVSRVKMARGTDKGGNPEVVSNTGVKRETGYLYYLDKDGDVSRSLMARGKKKNK